MACSVQPRLSKEMEMQGLHHIADSITQYLNDNPTDLRGLLELLVIDCQAIEKGNQLCFPSAIQAHPEMGCQYAHQLLQDYKSGACTARHIKVETKIGHYLNSKSLPLIRSLIDRIQEIKGSHEVNPLPAQALDAIRSIQSLIQQMVPPTLSEEDRLFIIAHMTEYFTNPIGVHPTVPNPCLVHAGLEIGLHQELAQMQIEIGDFETCRRKAHARYHVEEDGKLPPKIYKKLAEKFEELGKIREKVHAQTMNIRPLSVVLTETRHMICDMEPYLSTDPSVYLALAGFLKTVLSTHQVVLRCELIHSVERLKHTVRVVRDLSPLSIRDRIFIGLKIQGLKDGKKIDLIKSRRLLGLESVLTHIEGKESGESEGDAEDCLAAYKENSETLKFSIEKLQELLSAPSKEHIESTFTVVREYIGEMLELWSREDATHQRLTHIITSLDSAHVTEGFLLEIIASLVREVDYLQKEHLQVLKKEGKGKEVDDLLDSLSQISL